MLYKAKKANSSPYSGRQTCTPSYVSHSPAPTAAPRRSSDLGDGGRPAGGSCLGRVSAARRRAYSQPRLHQEAFGTFSSSFPASSLVLRGMWPCKWQARDMVSTLFPNEGTHHPYPSPVSNL